MWTVRILTGFGKHARENEKLKSDWIIPSLQEITNIFEQTKTRLNILSLVLHVLEQAFNFI